MTKKRLFLLVVMLLSGTVYSFAQTINVTGKVSESDGTPIIGGTVILKGSSSTGAVTDIDGNYSISVPGDAILEFRYIGLDSQDVPVNRRTVINVTLTTSNVEIEEVVVIGYGTQSRRSVTASIASVSGESFKDIPNPNAESALQGRAAGVSIITPNGGIGQAPVVRIRGVSSITSGTEPLYIVDGVPIQSTNVSSGTTNPLADINPADILSMDVLKDAAAAALYGSRAANGVVMITTRKGQQDRARVTYSGWVGITTPTKFIETMNAQQYVDFKNLAARNRYGTDEMQIAGSPTAEVRDLLPKLGEGLKAFNLWPLPDGGYVDTNWNDYIYQTGLQHSHSVAVSGGSARTQYYMSVNYTDQKGMVANDHFDRLGGSMNVTSKATDWLKIGANINASTTNTALTDNGRGGNIFATQGFSRMALIIPPTYPAYNQDGTPWTSGSAGLENGSNTANPGGYPNPVALIDLGTRNNSDMARIISSYFIELTPIKGLMLKTLYGVDYMNVAYHSFNTPFMGDAFPSNGSATVTRTKNLTKTWTNTAQYVFSIGAHNINALAGIEAYERERNRWGANRTDILDDKFTVFQADYANVYSTTTHNSIVENSLFSYFGRINYDFGDKYMLSLNYRRDGYSELSKNHRWGNFYGISGAWRITQESFFEPYTDFFSDLKIKGSWGVVGNTNLRAYASKSYYQSGFYGSASMYRLSKIADSENLKWESSTKMDIGFSAQLRRNITVEFDWYRNHASDLILDVPVAPSKGIPDNYITANAGKMSNTGIEFSISATPYKTRDFSWFTSFNITTHRNKVIKLADGIDELLSSDTYWQNNLTLPGYSIGQLYIRESRGIDPETGRRIVVGKNGEEILIMFEKSGAERLVNRATGEPYPEADIIQKIYGGTMPTYYGGWTNDLKYKHLDLSILFQYSGGNKIFNGTTATVSDMRAWSNSVDVYNNVWRQPGDNAKYAKPVYGDNYSNGSNWAISDWIERGDYLRLKTLTIGYSFDTKRWPRKVGVGTLRVYAMAQNLFCLTGYSGLDPESLISSNDNAALFGGIDKNTLPQSKVFTFGVNVSF
ncbi:MAG: TonB-dependent receptor [Tannerella sp.]|jgi:TonB-linked SusC/RagA family outer membrane protein|nr:TonB-dependent receptor [Tannerella sp.]